MTAPATDPVDAFDITTADLADQTPGTEYMVTDGEIVTDETPPPVSDAEPATPERERGPDGKFAKKADEQAPPDGEPVSQEAPAKPEPFVYRAFGENKTVEGVQQNADGTVTVTAEKASELRHLYSLQESLGQQSQYVDSVKAENAALKQENETLKQGDSAEIARANALVNAYSRMAQEPDEAKAIEAFFQFRANFPVLLARAEAQHYRTLAQRGKPQQDEPRAPEKAPVAPSLPSREDAIKATQDHIEHLKLDHTLKDLNADDWKQFGARLERTPYAYIRPASADEAKKLGMNAGDLVFDDVSLKADVEQHAGTMRKARETTQSATKLAADNARKTQPSITAPPTPGGANAPAKSPRKITNEKEWDDYMNSDEL